GPFLVPLISVLASPSDIVSEIVRVTCDDSLGEVGLFTSVQNQIYENICAFSGVSSDGSSKKRLIPVDEANLPPDKLVDTYLAGTPFHSVLLTSVPFSITDEQRFSGQWVIAPPGRGKTNLLHAMFLDDLKQNASIVV